MSTKNPSTLPNCFIKSDYNTNTYTLNACLCI